MKELAEDQSLRATGTVVEVDHPTRGKYLSVGNPIKLSDSPTDVARSPLLGEHTEEILRDVLGYDQGRIGEIQQSGAVGAPQADRCRIIRLEIRRRYHRVPPLPFAHVFAAAQRFSGSGSYKAAAVFQVQSAPATTPDIQHSFETELRGARAKLPKPLFDRSLIAIDRVSYWHNVFQT